MFFDVIITVIINLNALNKIRQFKYCILLEGIDIKIIDFDLFKYE